MTFGAKWAATSSLRPPLLIFHDAVSAAPTSHFVTGSRALVETASLVRLFALVTAGRFQRVRHLFPVFGRRRTAHRRLVRGVGLFLICRSHRPVPRLHLSPGTLTDFHPVLPAFSPELPSSISSSLPTALLRFPVRARPLTQPPPRSPSTSSGVRRRRISASGIAHGRNRSDRSVGTLDGHSAILADCRILDARCVR